MSPSVLLLTSIYDFSADLVALRLEEMGATFLRLNREQFQSYRVTLDPVGRSALIYRNGKLIGDSSSLKAIWFRQPVFLRNTPEIPLSSEDQLQRSQWTAFIRAFSIFDNVAWMNWPQATYLAEIKPYQLLVANRCGFRVPETLVGNDCDQFRNHFTCPIVVKSLDTVLMRDGDENLFTYTTRCNVQKLTDDTVASVPLMVQECCEPKTDCRVTVVGENVFAVKILKKGRPVEGDWRTTPKEDLEYIDIDLPQTIESACKVIVNKLGLVFGAIDLLETEDGFVFLEINPTGEWGWLTNEQRQLDLEIAKWLTSPMS
jgi:glutathione synthase/RimK-type ligase-like ATP-grasp enzyme